MNDKNVNRCRNKINVVEMVRGKEKYVVNNLAFKLLSYLKYDLDFIVLCVGSSKCIGDSLGCVVGSLLKYKYKIPNFCYGDFECNVSGANIEHYLDIINKYHFDKKVVVIDSVVGSSVDVGSVNVRYGGIMPRSAIDNSYDVVGDVAITGVVSCGLNVGAELLSVKHCDIMEMAEMIAGAICEYRRLVKNLNYVKSF